MRVDVCEVRDAVAISLANLKKQTSFSGSRDWVFASPLAAGKKTLLAGCRSEAAYSPGSD
jgi:hypothetical protein